jgi:hypothetical protein
MPEVACRIHGQSIDKIKHFIKTAQGTSESYYAYSNKHEGPLFGSGQGSGGSPPPLWLITWVALSNALSSIVTGMSFCSPDHSNPTSRNNDAFVDDTTGGVNDAPSISLTCGTNSHPIPITQKYFHSSHKTLGTGTMTADTNRLKAKASTIAAAIEHFEGPAWRAQLLWTSRYLPSLKYSLHNAISHPRTKSTKPPHQSYSRFPLRQG